MQEWPHKGLRVQAASCYSRQCSLLACAEMACILADAHLPCYTAKLLEHATHTHMHHAGVSEGRPRNVVQGVVGQQGADHWFSTNESAHPAPWVELHLPHNVRLLSLQHYTFTHGHHRSSYFRYAPSLHCRYHLGHCTISISVCIVIHLVVSLISLPQDQRRRWRQVRARWGPLGGGRGLASHQPISFSQSGHRQPISTFTNMPNGVHLLFHTGCRSGRARPAAAPA